MKRIFLGLLAYVAMVRGNFALGGRKEETRETGEGVRAKGIRRGRRGERERWEREKREMREKEEGESGRKERDDGRRRERKRRDEGVWERR